MLKISCSSVKFKLERVPKTGRSKASTSSLQDKFLFRGNPSTNDTNSKAKSGFVQEANTMKGANRFLQGLTLDVFHSAGNMDVELRLYSESLGSSWGFGGCNHCGNSSKGAPDRARLEEIKDVQLNIYFENNAETSSTFSVRGDPSNCPVQSPFCPCNNAANTFCLTRRSLCGLNIFEKYIQETKNGEQFVSCCFENIHFCTEPHVMTEKDFEEPLVQLNTIMEKKRSTRTDYEDKDITLVCATTGTEFPCHKFILSAQSEVFVAMFASGMSESGTKKVALTGVLDLTVEALLNYMYKGSLQIPFSRSDIALELLELAHQYAIQPLVDKLLQILENEELDRISVSTAIKMFSFCIPLQGMSQFSGLMKRSAVIVKKNVDVLEDHPDFQELFQENPSLAKQLFVKICNT